MSDWAKNVLNRLTSEELLPGETPPERDARIRACARAAAVVSMDGVRAAKEHLVATLTEKEREILGRRHGVDL